MRVLEPPPAGERQDTETAPSTRLAMRVEGRTVELPPGRTTIGSNPRCDLRLQRPGVQPVHCLIVNNGHGASARRWAGEAFLNGAPFDEAPLAASDCLTIGSVELEIAVFAGECQRESRDATDAVAPTAEPAAPEGPQQQAPQEQPTDAARGAGLMEPHPACGNAGRSTAAEDEAWLDVAEQLGQIAERLSDWEAEQARRQQFVERWEARQAEWDAQWSVWQQQFRDCETRVEELGQVVAELRQQVAMLRQGSGSDSTSPAPVDSRRGQAELHWPSLQLSTPDPASSQPEAPVVTPATAEPDAAAEIHGEPISHVPAKPPVESFIERYAHLLREDEDTAREEPVAPAAERGGSERVASPAAAEAAGDDEQAIEEYMAKLLARMRGDSAPQAAASASPPVQVPVEEHVYDEHLMPEQAESVNESAAAGLCDGGAEPTEISSKLPSGPPTDIEALRAIANQTARQAIGRYTLRTSRRKLTTKVIVAMLAGMTSTWLMMQSPGWRDWEFVAACISLLIAAYWGGEAYNALVETYCVSYDESDESIEPLPIDVEAD